MWNDYIYRRGAQRVISATGSVFYVAGYFVSKESGNDWD